MKVDVEVEVVVIATVAVIMIMVVLVVVTMGGGNHGGDNTDDRINDSDNCGEGNSDIGRGK